MEGGLTLNNKTITLGLAVIVFILLATFFISQNHILDRENRIENIILEMAQMIKHGNWIEAEKSFNKFSKIWKNGKYVIALNNAEQNFLDMSDAIENLRGAIEIRDSYKAYEIVIQIAGYWKNFKKIIPEP